MTSKSYSIPASSRIEVQSDLQVEIENSQRLSLRIINCYGKAQPEREDRGMREIQCSEPL